MARSRQPWRAARHTKVLETTPCEMKAEEKTDQTLLQDELVAGAAVWKIRHRWCGGSSVAGFSRFGADLARPARWKNAGLFTWARREPAALQGECNLELTSP